MFGIMVLLFVRHHANIKRLENREESMMPFGLFYWYKQKHPDEK
jgi:glycerol-3-phosphate acyltransferase PlsY